MTDFEKIKVWIKITIAVIIIYLLGGTSGLWLINGQIIPAQAYWLFVYIGGTILLISIGKFLFHLRRDERWQANQIQRAINWHLHAKRESLG